jgi:hypothetical protein
MSVATELCHSLLQCLAYRLFRSLTVAETCEKNYFDTKILIMDVGKRGSLSTVKMLISFSHTNLCTFTYNYVLVFKLY